MPEDWFAWIQLSELTVVEQHAEPLLKPFGIRLNGASSLLQGFCGNQLDEERSLVLGLARGDKNADELEPFLLLPIADVEQFADSQQFSLEEELWITTLFGVDFQLIPMEHAVWITRLNAVVEKPNVAMVRELLGVNQQTEDRAPLRLQVSKSGLESLATEVARQRKTHLASRRRLPHAKMPESWEAAQKQVIRYAPLLAVLSDEVNSVEFQLKLSGDLLEIQVDLESPPAVPASGQNASVADEISFSGNHFESIDSNTLIRHDYSCTRLDPLLIDLGIAHFRCSPDRVEATEFEAKFFDAYADSFKQLLSSVRGFEAICLMPESGKPLAANEAVLLQFDETSDVESLLIELSERSNRLLKASKARVKYVAKSEPMTYELPSGKSKGRTFTGVRSTTDMIEAVGGQRFEEIVKLFEAIYGPDCKFQSDAINLGKGRWLFSQLPEKQSLELLGSIVADLDKQGGKLNNLAKEETALHGEWYIDRYQTWYERLDEISNHDTIGRKVKPSMQEAAPVHWRVERKGTPLQGTQLQGSVAMPMKTYQAAMEYLWAPKQTPKQTLN